MAPLLNTTLICNSTSACASALVKVQEQLDDAERLSYILGALLGIVFLLFVCSPLIFNLPKEDETPRTAQSPENNEIEMRDLGSGGEMPDPNDFVINEEEADISQVSLENPRHYRSVEFEGERFHIRKSTPTVFQGLGDERELARHCVRDPPTPSVMGEEGQEASSSGEHKSAA